MLGVRCALQLAYNVSEVNAISFAICINGIDHCVGRPIGRLYHMGDIFASKNAKFFAAPHFNYIPAFKLKRNKLCVCHVQTIANLQNFVKLNRTARIS
jgi:hypothetical protein